MVRFSIFTECSCYEMMKYKGFILCKRVPNESRRRTDAHDFHAENSAPVKNLVEQNIVYIVEFKKYASNSTRQN